MSENVALGIADICGLSVLGVCYLWVFSVALYNLMKKVPKTKNTSIWDKWEFKVSLPLWKKSSLIINHL